ncbi:MAG: ShlB/FhaC/HecB family hemolysin secretion/activation protein, partial [Desulfobacterales bacterium]|nr:ShlB/FhaC/HecB family hemolysin secretion/activation protein [Desulfobacterales bacterium]
ILFEGNDVIGSGELSEAVKDYVGKPLTMEEMGELTDQITIVYQEKGFILARAYLPEQEIADGVLKIAVAEGRIGKVKVTGKTGYHDQVIKRYFGNQEKLGVIKESALEKGLVLSNEIPKVKTDIVLQEGENAGEVDMAVNVKDTTFLSFGLDGGIDYNNFGSIYTSRDRYGATANIYDHYWGSHLKVRGVAGISIDDSVLITGDWKVPINSFGTRMDTHYIKANYAIGEGLDYLGLGGDTEIYGVKFVHPFIAKKNMRLELSGGYQHKHVESQISSSLRLDQSHTFHVGFNFDNLDRFLGKNIVFFNYRHGHLEPQKDYPWSDTAAAPSFSSVKLDLARIQKVYGYTSLLARGSGQYSSEKLVSSEQFVIGGYGSVRGHAPASNIGDSGYTLSAELMMAPPYVADKKLFGMRVTQMFQVVAFYDFGQVFVNDAQPGDVNTHTLAGAGLGFRIFYKDRFVFKYDFGVPVNKKNGEESIVHYVLGSINFF